MDSSSSETFTVTVTQREQWMVQNQVFKIYNDFAAAPLNDKPTKLKLLRDEHMEYLYRGLLQLGPSFCVLDANRPWLCYWILHSIALLGDSLDEELENNAIDFLSRCQDPHGGYGGGPGQLPHLATTYAAVNSLVTLGGYKSLSSINREKLYAFLRQMKDPSGSFRMHDGGETDVRACYTAISVASVLHILDYELIHNVGNYILSCQTYEGGIAGEPGAEAHGGYTFCGLATMILINEVDRLDLARLLDWVVFRQGVECGFQGRTNKLVDGCYSFWQGGTFPLIQRLRSILDEQMGFSGSGGDCNIDGEPTSTISDSSEDEEGSDMNSAQGLENTSGPVKVNNIGYDFLKGSGRTEPLFHSMGLQQYLLLCSQVPEGGFKDKPGKYRDYYHTCYCLSGLSVCQYSWSKDEDTPPLPSAIFGTYTNLLEPVHPLFNVVIDKYHEAREFFLSDIFTKLSNFQIV